MTMSRVLVIDDEDGMRNFIRRGLEAEGYTIREASDGPTGLASALSEPVDLVILDLGLPKLDGTEVLDQIREHAPDIPVMVVSARDDISDRVAALDRGAVDYVVKPFALAELSARVRLRLDSQRGPTAGSTSRSSISYGRYSLHIELRTIDFDGDSVILTPLETSLAEQLILNGGQVVTRQHLLREVWGVEEAPRRSNLVEVAIAGLRKRIGLTSIETVRGLGYRFIG